MNEKLSKALQASVARLLTPLVRVLLRYGVPVGTFVDIVKRVYVETAMESLTIPGRKPTISRASVITGLSRKEILRIQRLSLNSDAAAVDRYNRATRVVSGWVRDETFWDAAGNPAPLPFEGGGRSFSGLVKKFSGDVPPRAILDELLRVGSVERGEHQELQLVNRAYIPSASEEDKIAILGSDTADLIRTIDRNLQAPADQALFQLKVAYDNLPEQGLGKFRKLSSRRALRLLEQWDQELSRMDRDVNPASPGTGRMRAGLAIFYFEEDLSADSGGEPK